MHHEATRRDNEQDGRRHQRAADHNHEGGHHGGHPHHHEDGPAERGGGRHFRGGGGPRGDHSGGPRGRARRGEARYVLLDALRDGPKHGYEIIKALEERSAGRYAPSPGTVYPTMQFLEDQGLVRADQESERRVYALSEAGRAALEGHAADLADFWGRFAGPAESDAARPEVGFLRDALDDLARTVWRGIEEQDLETVGRVRRAVDQCQNAVREILAATGRTEQKENPER